MKRLGVWGLEVALLVVLGSTTAVAADPPDSSNGSGGGGWVSHWFWSSDKPAPPKPKAKPAPPAPVAAEKPEPQPRPGNRFDEAVAEREKEVQALLRRQQVCLKLMRIAMESNDETLLHKAEQLDERARALYSQRTAGLPGMLADEEILERHLGPTNTAAPRPSERTARRTSGGQPKSQAMAQEEVP
jgi:hypothetical protein